MDERFEQPEREPHGASGQPDTTSQSESGRDPERERLLRETQIEIDRMKAAAMEEIQSSTAAYVQMQVQQACAMAQARIFMEEQEKTARSKEQSRQFSRLGLVLFAFMGVAFAAQLVLIVITMLVGLVGGLDVDFDNQTVQIVISAISMYGVAFPVAALLMRLIPKQGRPGGETWSAMQLAACLVICIGIGFVGILLSQFVDVVFPSGGDGVQPEDMMTGAGMLLNIAMVVFAAPVVEELLYRKMLIDRIAAYGDGVSVVVSGLLFGLAHGNFSQFFYAFGLGALFAYVYIKTGHIGYTIGFHMFFNLIGGVFTVELNKGLMEVRDPAGMVARLEQLFGVDLGPVVPLVCSALLTVYLVMSVVCAVGGLVILISRRKEIVFRPGEKPMVWGRRFSAVVLNPGVILYLLLCAGLFRMSSPV
ncbi:type II CAAX prenyl endopeptidase Rce1 family protein [Enterocloster asparagiformis]|uniref:CPBP family glutamic-type intramembrane protease n=1 Tax=Enterocloster asparagiformis TaxID=333367 RepID=UPI002A80F7EC|nr:CPBP family glutamic-type intramembrane protease [Enterocloster asparagiformis]